MYANVSIKKKKITSGSHNYASKLGEHLLRDAKHKYKLADPKNTKHNDVLIGMEEPTLAKALNNFLKKHKLKTRNKTTVQAYQMVFSIPKELKNDPQKIAKFKKHVLDFVNTDPKFKGNCLLLVYHHDEVQPHIQGVFVPRTPDNTLNFKSMLGGSNGSAKLHKLHDDYHDAVGKKLGLKRGDGSHTNGLEHDEYMEAVAELTKPLDPVDQVEPVKRSWNPLETFNNLEQENAKLRATNTKLQKNSKKAVFYETQNIELKKANNGLKGKVKKYEGEKMRATEEQLEKLRQIDCKDVLTSLGVHYKLEGTSARYKDTDAGINLVINSDNKFTENKTMVQGGGAIDLLVKIFGYKFTEAKQYLADKFGFDRTAKVISANPEHIEKTITEAVKKDVLELPPPKPNNLPKVKKYLTETRKIKPELVDGLIKSGLLYADAKSNCVFTNANGTFAFLRGTYEGKKFSGVRGEMDFIKYEFGKEKTNEVFLFESAIDALSFRELNPTKDGLYVVLNGNALVKDIQKIGIDKFSKVHCCFDNDEAGEKFCAKISEQTVATIEIHKPQGKDFNEDLINGKSSPTTQLGNLKTPK